MIYLYIYLSFFTLLLYYFICMVLHQHATRLQEEKIDKLGKFKIFYYAIPLFPIFYHAVGYYLMVLVKTKYTMYKTNKVIKKLLNECDEIKIVDMEIKNKDYLNQHTLEVTTKKIIVIQYQYTSPILHKHCGIRELIGDGIIAEKLEPHVGKSLHLTESSLRLLILNNRLDNLINS